MDDAVLQVEGLKTHMITRQGVGKAVDGVSFTLKRGETLGLVGESGCGKSMTCLSILRLVPKPAAHIVGGRVVLNGQDLLELDEGEMRHYRGKQIAMVVQDPMASLNPVFTVGDQVGEPLQIHQGLRGQPLLDRVIHMLSLLRIPAPETRVRNYPHQFSGGMRQRVVGAIALSCEPSVLIADEPTTSLDATIQAQYLRLLRDLQQREGLSIIFVTHDFGIISKVCDRVAVMYTGRIVETATIWQLFYKPAHPYTKALLNSVPSLSERRDRLYAIEGQPPSIFDLPQGCHFANRCAAATTQCREAYPPERTLEDGHTVSCWRAA